MLPPIGFLSKGDSRRGAAAAAEVALPRAPADGKWSGRPKSRAASAGREWHGRSWVNPSSAIPDYEKFCPPGAIRLAIPGPVRAVARLRRAGRATLVREHQHDLSPAEDPLLQREL